MSTQILTTKLYSPQPRARMVARSRLVQRLNEGLQPGRQLILISASAGFGKTTLVSEWITASRLEKYLAWFSLDAGENDPVTFLRYLIAALQQVDPAIGREILPLLMTSQQLPLMELVAQLINQVAAAPEPVILVLDDYHLISAQDVHQIVQLLIERQPSQMHIVILTREDPPFPLPRMRARGQVVQIRERDLVFTLSEAQAFLVEAMGLDLSMQDVEKLKDRTEGWAAGMQLAALALEEHPDPATRQAFIEAFAGSDRFIVDYLVSEVLQKQPEPTRRFLLATSILERFCADLCDQVVYGAPEDGISQAMLDTLEQGNMFLVPLDNQRRWYRYHHLFAEMLRHSLARAMPGVIAGLHRSASGWFEAHNFVPEAVRHALASQDWGWISALLARHAMPMLMVGQGSLVLDWCRALPREQLAKSPEICIYYALALVLTFRTDYLDEVEEKVQLAERALVEADLPTHARVGEGEQLVPLRDWVRGMACGIRSQILLGRFQTFVDPQELVALSQLGLEQLPEVERTIRSLCRINLAHAMLMQNEAGGAQAAFEEALPFMLAAHNYLGSVTAIFYLARLAFYQGQMERAEALCRQWKVKFVEMSGKTEREIPALRGLDIVLCLLMMERGQFAEAERLLVESLELLGWASWMDLYGFIMLARLRYQRGDSAGVEQVLSRMASLGPQHASCAETLRHLFAVKSVRVSPQQRSQAEAWVSARVPNLSSPVLSLGIGPYHCDVEYFYNLSWAQVQTALGHPAAALSFIQPALETARQKNLAFRTVELGVALVLAQDAQGNDAAALKALDDALEAAAPCGYVQVFDEGPTLDRLLGTAAQRSRQAGYARLLLASFQRTPASDLMPVGAPHTRANGGSNGGLVEPLSEREMQVLRLIEAGLSNSQIGARLYISQGTVKRHISNLYGKLEVESRTQAVAKAREIGLFA